MIHWGESGFLYLLPALPLLLILMAASRLAMRRRLWNLADRELARRLTDTFHAGLWWLKAGLFLLGLALMIVALARPKWGEKLQLYKGQGIDIVVALDASKSMLAQDIKPSRLERAKVELAGLLDNLGANRVGVVAFAGEAYVMCPLTTDLEAAKLFLDIIDPGNLPRPGTNIQRALEVSASLFDPGQEESKAVVLLTDGDNLEGDPLSAAAGLKEVGAKLFIVGIGTPEGSTIPEPAAGGVAYKKDREDKLVVSRLGDRLMLLMAKAADGRYYRSEGLNLNNLAAELERIKKRELEGGEFVEYQERYQGFLLVSFILIFLSIFLSDRRGAWFDFSRLEFKRLKSRVIVVFAVLGLADAAMAGVGSKMRAGNAQMKKGNFQEALQKYQEALVLEPDNVKIHYNIGRALYKMDKHQEAASEFQLGMLSKDRKFQSRTMYNIGNCAYRQGGLDQAIQAYTMSLILNPKDLQAKQNLELALKMKEQQQGQSDSTKQNQNQQHNQPQQPKPKPQPQKGQMSREEADRVLKALENRERENLKKQKERPQPEQVDKDW